MNTVPLSDITLRDYLAAQALIGLMKENHFNVYQLARDSYYVADAMLEERKNDPA